MKVTSKKTITLNLYKIINKNFIQNNNKFLKINKIKSIMIIILKQINCKFKINPITLKINLKIIIPHYNNKSTRMIKIYIMKVLTIFNKIKKITKYCLLKIFLTLI